MAPRGRERSDRALHEIRYAAAALLVVCAKSDFEEHPEEIRAITELLEETFELEHEMIVELMSYVDEDTGVKGLEAFTHLVNQHYSEAEKKTLVESLWRVAHADGRVDQFEEQFISRVAFMIDVTQAQVGVCRQEVESS